MQNHHFFKIKTVNLDPDIFIQQNQNTKKSPISLLRSFTQRKGSTQSSKRRVTSGQKLKIPCLKEDKQPCQFDSPQPNDTEPLFTGFERSNLKKHNKTNPSNPNQSPQRQSRRHFKRYQQPNLQAFQLKEEDPQIELPLQTKENYQKQRKQDKTKDIEELLRVQQKAKVNPYTKTQYIYMRNHKIDELMQLKRSGRVRQASSITKSYKVTTINLTPQIAKRSQSFKLSIPLPTSPSKNRYSPFSLTPVKKESQIKPWESAQSKQYLD